MKTSLGICSFLVALLVSTQTLALEVAGVAVPPSVQTQDTTLTLNGAGLRTRLVLKLYVGALYLPEPTSDSSAIVQADEPMAIWLRIRSKLVTREKMVEALNDGFAKATGGNTQPIQAEIAQLLDFLPEKVKKKDQMLMSYHPQTGTHFSMNGEEVGVIPGLPFKQALFGIWLSDKPVQASLKKSMLGG